METLNPRRLNRALLARQLLLDRLRLDPVRAVERLGALQAQEPASPYLALHARLEGFDPPALSTAIHQRRLVKATLMRSALHLVSADDYAHYLPAMGLWWTHRDSKDTPVRIVFESFQPLSRADRAALDAEAEPLLDFVPPHEPGVFGRFRGTPARRRLDNA